MPVKRKKKIEKMKSTASKAGALGKELELRPIINKLEGQVAEFEGEVEELTDQIYGLNEHVYDLEDQVYDLEEQTEELEVHVSELLPSSARLQQQVESDARHKGKLARQTDLLEREFRNATLLFNEELEELNDKLASKSDTLVKMQRKYIQLESESHKAAISSTLINDDIDSLEIELSILEIDRALNAEKIQLLRVKINNLKKGRRNNFAYLASLTYIKSMRKINTPAGDIELQALANYLNNTINILCTYEEDQLYIRKTYKSEITNTTSANHIINLLLVLRQEEYYFEALPNDIQHDPIIYDHSTITIPYGHDLFDSYIKALKQIESKIDSAVATSANQMIQPEDHSLLYIAGYALRLRVCKYIEENVSNLETYFNNIAITFENNYQVRISESALNILLSYLPTKNNVKDKIKLILMQNYVSYFRDEFTKSIGHIDSSDSDKTLDDISGVKNIFDTDISLETHEENVKLFLQTVSANYISSFNPTNSINMKVVGGPIEIQAIVDLFDINISLSAFRGSRTTQIPDYTKEFSKNPSEMDTKHKISLILIHAGTSEAAYISMDSNRDAETGPDVGRSIFVACARYTHMLSRGNLHNKVYLYLKNKKHKNRISGLKYTDEIKKCFEDYIYAGAKKHPHKLTEMDLIFGSIINEHPDSITNKAIFLHQERKSLFKSSKMIIKQLTTNLQDNIVDWPLTSSIEEGTTLTPRLRNIRYTEKIATLLLTLSMLTNIGTIVTSILSANDSIDLTPESMALAASLISYLQQFVNYNEIENKKKSVIKSLQNAFIHNLSKDLLSELYFIDAGVTKNMFTDPDFANSWSRITVTRAIFKFKDNRTQFSITKYASPFLDKIYQIRMQNVAMITNLSITTGELASSTAALGVSENPTLENDHRATYAATAFAAISIFINFVMLAKQAHFKSKNDICALEIKNALLGMANTCSKKGTIRMPKIYTEMMLRFGDKGIMTRAFANAPKMQNIQRSIDKTREELKRQLVTLESYSTSEVGDEREKYNILRAKINMILETTTPQNIDQVYLRHKIAKDVADATIDAEAAANALTKTHSRAINQSRGLFYSRISSMINNFGNVVRFASNRFNKPAPALTDVQVAQPPILQP